MRLFKKKLIIVKPGDWVVIRESYKNEYKELYGKEMKVLDYKLGGLRVCVGETNYIIKKDCVKPIVPEVDINCEIIGKIL